MTRPQIKICGIKTRNALDATLMAQADYVGLVFHAASPRAVSVDAAAPLCVTAGGRIKTIGLFVDPDDAFLDSITKRIGLDFIQLHGHEDPRRVQAVRSRTGLPVIKAIRVAGTEDLSVLHSYESVADWILFDAKVAGLSGGTGTAFDWTLLKGLKIDRPWMLSGGLNEDNIRNALQILSPDAVDVSSGVEDAPGHKSPEKIKSFIQAVRQV